mgnify:CR=1 FL=1
MGRGSDHRVGVCHRRQRGAGGPRRCWIVGATLLLLNARAAAKAVDSPFARDGAAAAAIVTTLSQAHHVRPQLFSPLLFAILLSCLMAARRGSQRSLWILPPLFAAWANLHGGWIVGGGVLALLDLRPPRGGRTATGFSGVRRLEPRHSSPRSPRRMGSDSGAFCRKRSAFRGLRSSNGSRFTPWVGNFSPSGCWHSHDDGPRHRARRARERPPGARPGLASRLRPRHSRLRGSSRFSGWHRSSWSARRSRTRTQRRRDAHPRNRGRVLRFGFAAVACALGVFAIVAIRTNVWDLRLDAASMPEPEAVAFLSDQPAGTRVLVWFNWGEYAIWHLSPRMRVSIDGRRETVLGRGADPPL